MKLVCGVEYHVTIATTKKQQRSGWPGMATFTMTYCGGSCCDREGHHVGAGVWAKGDHPHVYYEALTVMNISEIGNSQEERLVRRAKELYNDPDWREDYKNEYGFLRYHGQTKAKTAEQWLWDRAWSAARHEALENRLLDGTARRRDKWYLEYKRELKMQQLADEGPYGRNE